ncbi:MAG TPA: M23 family metallopeptidase [Longimicrobium sp.]|nr:M23 family metallopeptidase [Longimicrobium sp.]
MRILRFLLPFSLGAVSMLAAVLAVAWGVPDLRGRLHTALGSGSPSPAPPAPVAVTPPAPVAVVPPAPVAVVPPAPEELAEPTVPDGVPVRLLIPVRGVRAASLVDTYDQARGAGRRHDAIDIMAPRGTPVLATADGVVMKLFTSVRGGITLYQMAPDRRTIYYYAHLDRYAPGIAEGKTLRRGEVLGYVGNTGSAGPGNYHLHFEVTTTADPAKYWGGTPRNPYPLLR